ncbi:hypothetical protein [Streptacidiphilus sp. EB103A]|uniref:hypothetical protein n=1 Tax=Streptacidiphilus sp. EB103A TaxID=3156275 RepID=UPI003517BE59
MKRSLRRNIERAVNETYGTGVHRAGMAGVLLLFPKDAFADMPTAWHPGEAFENVLAYTWLRDNGDGTATAVVAGVWPKERPALDGGEWTEPEVWTVTADRQVLEDTSSLGDKPQRITWMLDVPGAHIVREPYATHPVAAVEAYWERFEKDWGFVPNELEYGKNPLGPGRRWLMLTSEPGFANIPNEDELLRIATILIRRFNAEARVYSYNIARREMNGPLKRSGLYGPLNLVPIARALERLGHR